MRIDHNTVMELFTEYWPVGFLRESRYIHVTEGRREGEEKERMREGRVGGRERMREGRWREIVTGLKHPLKYVVYSGYDTCMYCVCCGFKKMACYSTKEMYVFQQGH